MTLVWFFLLCVVIINAPHIRQVPALIYTAIFIALAIFFSIKG